MKTRWLEISLFIIFLFLFIVIWIKISDLEDVINSNKLWERFTLQDWKDLYKYCAWNKIELDFLKR